MATTIVEDVKSFIENTLSIKRNVYYKGEKAVEKEMVKQMREHFGFSHVASQHSVGGFLNLKCDIDVYNGQCGIELKVAKELENASTLQRVLGQVFYYAQRRYKDTGLILLIVGTAAELNPKLDELKDYVETIPGVHFMYKQTAKKQGKDDESQQPTAHIASAPKAQNQPFVFHCNQGGSNASGMLVENGFLVFAGSAMRPGVRSSATSLFIEQRKQFIAQQCNIVDGIPVTKADYVFTSPSIAAGMFVGGSANGWTIWKNDDGKTLSKIYRKK